MNIEHKEPYTIHLLMVSTGVANQFLRDNPVNAGRVRYITHATIEDPTIGADFRVRLGRDKGAAPQHWFEEELEGSGGVLFWSNHPLLVPPGECFLARWTNTAIGDRLHMWLDGYTIPLHPPKNPVAKPVEKEE